MLKFDLRKQITTGLNSFLKCFKCSCLSPLNFRPTGIPQEQILESFGSYFFETIKKSGHSIMLRTLGHNLHGFLVNLDSLHDHLSVTYTEMQAPSFRCEKTGRGLILHYYSIREGLHTIVTGIVKAVAREYFRLDVDIKVEKYELTEERLSHHYVLRIDVKDAKRNDLERKEHN